MSGEFAQSMHMLLTTTARQHMNIYNMAIMSAMYVHGDSEPLDIARELHMSKSHMYRQLQYLKDKGVVRKTAPRKEYYRRKVELWGLTETGRRCVRLWEKSYRAQLINLVSWNDNLRAAGRMQ